MLYEVITPGPLGDPVPVPDGHQRLGKDHEEIVQFRAGLPPDLQDILEPLRRDQRCADPLPLEECIRRHGRPVNDLEVSADVDASYNFV